MALTDISFEIHKGDAIGIIGHNGAGKSTLLKLLSRVTAPTEGNIYIKGRIASMLEVGTGFHPELTGRENVFLNGAILGMTKSEIARKFDEIVSFAEMEEFIDTPVKRYSSGMYVRLAFAVAAHLDSEILVMDEVLAVGDMKFQQKCLERMANISNEEGRTIIYVSHNMSTIRQLCNRCIVLNHGKIKFNGDTEQAIAVYLDNMKKEMKIYNDYSNILRPDSFLMKQTVFLQHLEIKEKTDCLFENSEDLHFSVGIKTTENYESCKMMLRIEFRTFEDSGVATALCENLWDGEKNSFFEANLKIPLNNFSQGKYSAHLVLYAVDDYGASCDLDIIRSAFCFDIIKNTRSSIAQWNDKYWGKILLPDIEVINRTTEKIQTL